MNQYLLLVVGFVLTTVFGGLLGWFIQNRSWDHQNRVTTDQAHHDAAFATFQELSALMDKRLYRMRVLDDLLTDPQTSDKDLHGAREDYRQVRYEWNDNLNRNLARVQAYFGPSVRSKIENGVYEEFSRLHRGLRMSLQQRESDGDRDIISLGPQLDRASSVIYVANLAMLDTIRGTRQPDKDAADEPPPDSVAVVNPPSQRP